MKRLMHKIKYWHMILVVLLAASTPMLATTASASTVACSQPSPTVPCPTVLDPGGTASSLVAVTAYANILYASAVVAFGGVGPGPSGNLYEYASNAPVDNPFSTTDRAFEYVIGVTSGNVASISIPNFSGFQTAVGTCNANAPGSFGTCYTPANFPTSATRSSNGDVITFSFSTPVTSALSSGFFVVWTDAPDFIDPPMIDIYDSSGDLSTVSTFFSPAATPLPAALPLFATGLGVMGLFGWRKKRKNAAALAAA